MTGWLIGFSKVTWDYQLKSPHVLGFKRQNSALGRSGEVGDHAFAYVAGASKVCGEFVLGGGPFTDNSALYRPSGSGADIYSWRFPAKAVWLTEAEDGLPMSELVATLDVFKNARERRAWGGVLRNLPQRLTPHDTEVLIGRIAAGAKS